MKCLESDGWFEEIPRKREANAARQIEVKIEFVRRIIWTRSERKSITKNPNIKIRVCESRTSNHALRMCECCVFHLCVLLFRLCDIFVGSVLLSKSLNCIAFYTSYAQAIIHISTITTATTIYNNNNNDLQQHQQQLTTTTAIYNNANKSSNNADRKRSSKKTSRTIRRRRRNHEWDEVRMNRSTQNLVCRL